MNKKPPRIKWSKQAAKDDFNAGKSYLSLLFAPESARELTYALEHAEVATFSAKDVLRASELKPLTAKDPDVARQLKKIANGKPLSPLLLVRESGHARLIIADGFHRLCALNHLNRGEPVHCKIA